MRVGETKEGEFILIAHRGGGEFGPENSLEALRGALTAGVVNIETDVHQTADGELVISHENRLNLHTIQKSDFGWIRDHHPEIPTLDEYLNTADERCRFNLEIKMAEPEALLKALEGRDRRHLLLSSFNEEIVRGLRALDADLALGLLTFNDYFHRDKLLSFLDQVEVQALLPLYALCEERLVGMAHDRGLKVIAWTVNGLPHLERMLEMKVDGVFTDTYSEFRGFLEGSGRNLAGYPA